MAIGGEMTGADVDCGAGQRYGRAPQAAPGLAHSTVGAVPTGDLSGGGNAASGQRPDQAAGHARPAGADARAGSESAESGVAVQRSADRPETDRSGKADEPGDAHEPGDAGGPARAESSARGKPDPAAAADPKTKGATPEGSARPASHAAQGLAGPRAAITRLTGRRPRRAGRRARPAGSAGGEDIAGAAFARLTVLPTILAMAWLLPGLLLLLAGEFKPVPELLIGVPLAVILALSGLRHAPASWPRAVPGPVRGRRWAPWWATAGTLAVAAAFTAWQLLENSPAVIVTRDPGGYLQAGYWVAQHGSLPIPQSLAAFGGTHSALGFTSIDFFAHGGSVVPAFTSGLPMVLAGAFWTHGISTAAAMSPLLGGLAIVVFGGLVARLAGQQWAPAGALVLALTLPEQYTSRSAFSETLVQILLFGGLSLVIDALTVPGKASERARPRASRGTRRRLTHAPRPRWAGWLTPQRVLSGLGGLALGLTVLADAGAVVFLLAVIPFAGVLAAGRRPAALPFCCGVAIGTSYGLADGYLLARPFMDSLGPVLELIGLVAAWLVALTLAVVKLLRAPGMRAAARRILARPPLRWLPEAGGVLAVAVLIGLAVRPYLQVVRGQTSQAVLSYIAYLQRVEHLPIDPGRQYAEDTLYWVIWYVGAPAVLLGGFGIALLVRRCLRALLTWSDPAGAWRNWGLPLAVISLGSVAVLWRPDIVPDQPWASRRLVPVVIPGLIVCATWAAGWLAGVARERGAGSVIVSAVGVFCVGALVLPALWTTFGLGLSHAGRGGGLRPSASGMALRRTGVGQVAAVRALCASIPRPASVIIVDRRVAQHFSQVIRGMCGVPVGWMVGQGGPAVDNVLADITRAGRRPVLLAGRPGELTALGGSPVKVLDLVTTQPPHELAQPPTSPWPAHYVIWMAAIGSGATGT